MKRQKKMADLTPEEFRNYDGKRIHNAPLTFQVFDSDQRRAWVKAELASGDYTMEKKLSARDILSFGSGLFQWCPEYFLYLILLARHDPAEAEAHITNNDRAIFFLRAYGLEQAMPFVSSQQWLTAIDYFIGTAFDKKTRQQIRLLLKERGAEQIAPLIDGMTTGLNFLDIFGIEALPLLPHDLAKQIRGLHLESELGL
jgi:hypothetical protein